MSMVRLGQPKRKSLVFKKHHITARVSPSTWAFLITAGVRWWLLQRTRHQSPLQQKGLLAYWHTQYCWRACHNKPGHPWLIHIWFLVFVEACYAIDHLSRHFICLLFEEGPEWFHDGCCCMKWGQLVHEPIPWSYARDGGLLRHTKVMDSTQAFLCMLVDLATQVVPNNSDLPPGELEELFGLKGDSCSSTGWKEIICMPKSFVEWCHQIFLNKHQRLSSDPCVMNVVSGRLFSSNLIWWYAQWASAVALYVCMGMLETISKGAGVWWLSWRQWTLWVWKWMVQRGWPLLLRTLTIFVPHSVASPVEICSITSFQTSSSNYDLTSSSQCLAASMGVW